MTEALRHVGRLYWRIWLAIIASVAVFAFLATAAWRWSGERPLPPEVAALAELAAEVLPAAGTDSAQQQAALERWKQRFHADFALRAADGSVVAYTSEDLIAARGFPDERVVHTERGPAFVAQLDDGRALLVRRSHMRRIGPAFGPIPMFALLALAVGVGAYPVVRRLTRRLERLQAGVTQLGAGDLTARVAVEGKDEVGQLAASFNDAAARIEQLVNANRSLLANASHELRSPLARLRLGIELMADQPSAQRRAALARDIAELDQLIDEILLASRLEGGPPLAREPLDLTGLVAEECASHGAQLAAPPLTVLGNARLLQRLVRNLLDNARRHGGGEVDVELRASGADVQIDVRDRGPGVPDSERERVFEPFYRVSGSSEMAGGVGLGLALVRQIALQHGGSVRCLPRENGGSIFRVTLPSSPTS